MKLVAARTFAWLVLVALYVLSPLIGVAALATCFGFVAGQRLPRLEA